MKKIADKCEICGKKFHGAYRKGNKMMCLCSKHLHHMNRYGRILKRTRFDKNELIKRKGYYDMIIYDRNNKIIAKTKIDNDVLNRIKKHKWSGSKKGKSFYVKTDIRNSKKREALYLPSLILGKKQGYQIDHKSGDSLDNRRKNLRFATQQQNLMNKSRALGYSKEKRSGLWHVYIGVKNGRINLGRVKTKIEAQKIRREAELKYYGDFAKAPDNKH